MEPHLEPKSPLDEFDKTIQFLSDLPTEKTLKELKNFNLPATRKVIETMALSKQDFIKSLRLMEFRAKHYEKLYLMQKASNTTDKVIAEYLEKHPEFDPGI